MSAPLEFQEAVAALRFYLANHPQPNVLSGAIRTVLDGLPTLPEMPAKQEPVRLDCKCPEFAPGVKKIEGPVLLQQIRAGRPFPDGHFIPWRYCPWCGARLAFVEGAP